jgi:hypothetical protein
MAVTYNCLNQNSKGAKESGELLAKPFKLEQALYTKVKEHEIQEADNLKPRTSREKKAVDFFLRRRVRCDKFVKESVAASKPDDGMTEEERARYEEEKLQAELRAKAGKMEVEHIEVQPMSGEIKMAPMSCNLENNGNTATPFGSQRASQCSQAWSSVKFGSVSDGIVNPAMMNSVMSCNSNSLFDSAISTPRYASQKKYKPVNYMNFKSKQKVPKDFSFNQKLDTSVDDILKRVHAKEEAQKKMAADAKNREEAGENKSMGYMPNGVQKIGLCKTSLPGKTGKWRPSNDNWRPGVNTDGFFTALAALNEKKEANKNKKVVYGETSYNTNNKAFSDNSLATALSGL